MTIEREKKVLQAFDAIHALGVLHGDIRAENILVENDGKVWIIDFEFSLLLDEDEASKKMLAAEKSHVIKLLVDLKTKKT